MDRTGAGPVSLCLCPHRTTTVYLGPEKRVLHPQSAARARGVGQPVWGHVLCGTRLDPPDPAWPYQVLETHYQAIKGEVARMLQDGIIEESTSCWSSPTVTVPKLDGSFWISNDFQRLKQVSELDCYPLSQVDDLVDQVAWVCFISTFDLTKGYCQMALTPNARRKTVFSTTDSAASTHMASTGLLQPSRGCKCKCCLGLTEVQYLGYHIGQGLLKPQGKRLRPSKGTPSLPSSNKYMPS